MNTMRAGMVLGLALVVAATGCGRVAKKTRPAAVGPDPEAVKFHETLTGIQKSIDNAYENLGQALVGMMGGTSPNFGEMKKSREQYAKSVATAKVQLKSVSVPNLEGAEEWHKAQLFAVEAEETALKNVTRVIEVFEGVLAQRTTMNPVEMEEKIRLAGEARKIAQEQVGKAREQFVRKHKL
jgi:hypothetical protein